VKSDFGNSDLADLPARAAVGEIEALARESGNIVERRVTVEQVLGVAPNWMPTQRTARGTLAVGLCIRSTPT